MAPGLQDQLRHMCTNDTQHCMGDGTLQPGGHKEEPCRRQGTGATMLTASVSWRATHSTWLPTVT